MSEVIKLNGSELNKLVENIVINTLFENKIIRIVEERGMFGEYRNLIHPITGYVNNYIKDNEPNERLTTPTSIGEYPVEKYIVDIPQKFFNRLTWIENKKLVIEIFNLDERGVDLIGLENIINYRSGQNNLSVLDRLTADKKLEKFEMKIVGFSQDECIFMQNIQSSLYHEFTHAFDNYKRLKNTGDNLFTSLKDTSYQNISKWKEDNNLFKFVQYYLLNQTELSANIAGVYGDLERIKSIRKNFNNDIKETDAYKNYRLIKYNYLPNLLKLSDSEWENFRTQTFQKYISTPEVPVFKRDFQKFVDLKLNDLYRGIGKVASQYYDDHETKSDFKDTTLVMH